MELLVGAVQEAGGFQRRDVDSVAKVTCAERRRAVRYEFQARRERPSRHGSLALADQQEGR